MYEDPGATGGGVGGKELTGELKETDVAGGW